MFLQNTVSPDYTHWNLESIEGISSLNTEGYKSLKEAVLVSINSNKPLEVSKKFESLHAINVGKIKTFIKDIEKEIQDNSQTCNQCKSK
ncbi:hypothetical protein G6F46_006969 [Rhizopus delemar]|uniref:Uncharacterized protein n=3 Tax=Rhizopus TaxID=4842 RepID=I1BIA2_RHIO9|nr:hypothetical protein RO3G_00636 [Rhizopus delemar RA 99-880]KAG1166584.1 hypothetical protein G6F36_012890 [Rhizopus arrhizus]KAG1458093.1 hypothetical protein G6F55_005548 [Rhizopus delemar]KAG1496600.1 hypothetical protein G6F54_006354 [Rhizopus delemar]KAG1510171.1 hypothetical protein G6F53_006883 [Rhizopus delemar]|eukprot:EIE75932.1 hypothetical protein RO3G_00636 [Rhizopus delemar RA 99-880]